MNIGIFVHSYTNNTWSVAQQIADQLKVNHTVTLQRIIAIDEKPSQPQSIQLASDYDARDFDWIILAAPVRAFSISPVLKVFLQNTEAVKHKPTCVFVTQHFPFPWLGGNQSIKQIIKLAKTKGFEVRCTAIINWSNKKREDQIQRCVTKFANQLHETQ